MRTIIGRLSLVLLLIVSSNGFSQSPQMAKHHLFSLGIGLPSKLFEHYEGVSLGLSYSTIYDKNCYTLRFIGNSERIGGEGPSPIQSISELSVLYGRSVWQFDRIFIKPSIGVGMVRQIERGSTLNAKSVDGDYKRISRSALGFASGLEALVYHKNLGLGFHLFTDWNSIQSYWGGLIGLYSGF